MFSSCSVETFFCEDDIHCYMTRFLTSKIRFSSDSSVKYHQS